MDTNMVLNASFNELVFENRHKDYGAYQIRKRYSRNVLLAGFFATSLFAAALGAYFINLPDALAVGIPKGDPNVVVRNLVILDDQKKDREIVKPKLNPPPKGASSSSGNIVVTKDSVMPVQPLDTAGRSPKGIVGGTGRVEDTTSNKPCIGCDSVKKTTKRIAGKKDGTSPKDPGIDEFFKKNIKYPVFARERGIQGTVWLSFVVDTKGDIKEIQIIKSADPMLDKEVLRVAKLMPKWDPVSEDGELVEFIYNKPVRFVLPK